MPVKSCSYEPESTICRHVVVHWCLSCLLCAFHSFPLLVGTAHGSFCCTQMLRGAQDRRALGPPLGLKFTSSLHIVKFKSSLKTLINKVSHKNDIMYIFQKDREIMFGIKKNQRTCMRIQYSPRLPEPQSPPIAIASWFVRLVSSTTRETNRQGAAMWERYETGFLQIYLF